MEKFCQNTTENVTQLAVAAYASVLDSLGEEITTVVASVLLSIIVALIFGVAFQFKLVGAANEHIAAMKERELELLKRNDEIQQELELNVLDDNQQEIVHGGTSELDIVKNLSSTFLTITSKRSSMVGHPN